MQPQKWVTPKKGKKEEKERFPYRFLSEGWVTLSRAQYHHTCGISSLVSIWNYQFSKLGIGKRQPICVEQALEKLKVLYEKSPQSEPVKCSKSLPKIMKKQEESEKDQIFYQQSLKDLIKSIPFGSFTGNKTIMKWYQLLCQAYGGKGKPSIFYKIKHKQSIHHQELDAKRALIKDLYSGKTSFIYHAYNHYFCPVGYEFTPEKGSNQLGTFSLQEISDSGYLCILVAEPSPSFPVLHSFDWKDIQQDLETPPEKFEIRKMHKKVSMVEGKQKKKTKCCLLSFQKLAD